MTRIAFYILRHANADTDASTDDDRELSDKGREQAKAVARFCARHGLGPEVIFSSPLIRAQQTAEPVAKELGMEMTTVEWMRSGVAPEEICTALAEQKGLASAMLVGHEPDLGRLIAHLLGSANGSINVRKASLSFLEVAAWRKGGARLEFFVPARFV